MKTQFLDFSLNLIKKNKKEYTQEKLAELRYGLEGIYLTFTKLIIIVIGAIAFQIAKETFLLIIFFNILRLTGFGIHAKKSSHCLILSLVLFVLLPIFSKHLIMNFYFKIFITLAGIVLIYLWSPADTKKRPLINKNKRTAYKLITTFNSIVLASFAVFINDQVVSNLLIFAIYIQISLVSPITYKLTNNSYNNYKTYRP